MRFYHYVWYKVQQQQVQLTDISMISGIWSGDYEDRHRIKIFWDNYGYDINMNLKMSSAICVSASLWWLISILGIVPLGNKFCLYIWHQQGGPLLDGITVRSKSVMIKLTVNRKKMIPQYTNIQSSPQKDMLFGNCFTIHHIPLNMHKVWLYFYLPYFHIWNSVLFLPRIFSLPFCMNIVLTVSVRSWWFVRIIFPNQSELCLSSGTIISISWCCEIPLKNMAKTTLSKTKIVWNVCILYNTQS